MLHRISIKLTSLLFLNRTRDESFEICVYGLELFLVSRICVLFVAGIYILFFYINSDYCRPVGIGMLYAAFSRFSGYLSSKLKTT